MVQTDMSLPKDIDTIDIQVIDEGASEFGNCFDLAGMPCNAIRLPATLGLLQPPVPTDVHHHRRGRAARRPGRRRAGVPP